MAKDTKAARPAAPGAAADPRDTGPQQAPAPAPAADAAQAAPGGRRERKPLEDTVTVRVHTTLRLTTDDGRLHVYDRGVQEMPRSHAEHWYAKHHIADPDEV